MKVLCWVHLLPWPQKHRRKLQIAACSVFYEKLEVPGFVAFMASGTISVWAAKQKAAEENEL